MTVTPLPARAGVPLLGGFAPAMSAVEGLTRGLSAELAPNGIRAVGLRVDGMPDSGTMSSRAKIIGGGSHHSPKWPMWRPSWLPMPRAR